MICDITPFSMIDYPDNLSAIFWFSGCNMRCQYCYNVEFLNAKGEISEEMALEFLKSRVGLLDGVVLSGGESSLYKNLLPFCRKIKSLGFKIKLDTNGSTPDRLSNLLESNLLDFISLDFKGMRSFEKICGKDFLSEFKKSLHILLDSKIPFEVRSTFHSALLKKSELLEMAKFLTSSGYRGNFYIQNFVGDKPTIAVLPKSKKAIFSDIEMEKYNIVIR